MLVWMLVCSRPHNLTLSWILVIWIEGTLVYCMCVMQRLVCELLWNVLAYWRDRCSCFVLDCSVALDGGNLRGKHRMFICWEAFPWRHVPSTHQNQELFFSCRKTTGPAASLYYTYPPIVELLAKFTFFDLLQYSYPSRSVNKYSPSPQVHSKSTVVSFI